MRAYSGNRLAVPHGVRSKHFFYKAQAPTCSSASLDKLAHLVKPLLRRRAVGDTIEVVGRETVLRECGSAAAAAWDEVSTALPKFTEEAEDDLEILGCEWSRPHVDPILGNAIYSLVIHTGPFPYRMQTLHTRRRRIEGYEVSELVTSTRDLRVGETFVFDPTTPHWVVPERPHQEQILVLMQAKFADVDEEDRAHLLRNIKPEVGDRNEQPSPQYK
jgi:hypothetical protein